MLRPLSCQPQLDILEDRTLMSTCHVTRLVDQGIGQGLRGDLRYCINYANNTPGADVIDFAVIGTIQLKSALPDLKSEIDVQGPGPSQLTVRGGGQPFRVFNVTSGPVRLHGLRIADAHLVGGSNSSGAGIRNYFGILEISSCEITNNSAVSGAGIQNYGRLIIRDTTISNNDASSLGGGIDNNGNALVERSTIHGNQVFSTSNPGFAWGGGIFNGGILTIVDSTISQNTAETLTSPFEEGGGIFASGASGSLTINSSTVTENRASTGGGIGGNSSFHMHNTIVAGNSGLSGPDCKCNLVSSGYNLIGNSQGGSGFESSDLLNVDPLLGSLANNGGPTPTHALLPGSPAIDAGDNTDAPEWDQRGIGFPRIVNGTIDIGAFEVQSSPLPGNDSWLAILITADLNAD